MTNLLKPTDNGLASLDDVRAWMEAQTEVTVPIEIRERRTPSPSIPPHTYKRFGVDYCIVYTDAAAQVHTLLPEGNRLTTARAERVFYEPGQDKLYHSTGAILCRGRDKALDARVSFWINGGLVKTPDARIDGIVMCGRTVYTAVNNAKKGAIIREGSGIRIKEYDGKICSIAATDDICVLLEHEGKWTIESADPELEYVRQKDYALPEHDIPPLPAGPMTIMTLHGPPSDLATDGSDVYIQEDGNEILAIGKRTNTYLSMPKIVPFLAVREEEGTVLFGASPRHNYLYELRPSKQGHILYELKGTMHIRSITAMRIHEKKSAEPEKRIESELQYGLRGTSP